MESLYLLLISKWNVQSIFPRKVNEKRNNHFFKSQINKILKTKIEFSLKILNKFLMINMDNEYFGY